MAAKGWWIGCGTLVVVGAVIGVLAIGYFASRASEFTRAIESAQDRYEAINRDFPFSLPPSGELSDDRFARYLQVRAALHSAMSPMQESRGVFEGLSVLRNLPEEVSRVHVEALRQQSMSIDEYMWITRQLFTTAAAERHRKDPDPALEKIENDFGRTSRRRGNVIIQTNTSNSSDDDLLDYTWLRVPDATREVVRKHVAEITETSNAVMAESLLMSFGRLNAGRNPR